MIVSFFASKYYLISEPTNHAAAARGRKVPPLDTDGELRRGVPYTPFASRYARVLFDTAVSTAARGGGCGAMGFVAILVSVKTPQISATVFLLFRLSGKEGNKFVGEGVFIFVGNDSILLKKLGFDSFFAWGSRRTVRDKNKSAMAKLIGRPSSDFPHSLQAQKKLHRSQLEQDATRVRRPAGLPC
jgi:hypothetical protein